MSSHPPLGPVWLLGGREACHCLAQRLPAPSPRGGGGAVLSAPRGSLRGGPQAVQRALCLGWTQLFPPFMETWAAAGNQALGGTIKGHRGVPGPGAVLQLLTARHLPHPTCPEPAGHPLLPWAGPWEPRLGRKLGGAKEHRAGPPAWHPGLSLQACQRGTGCERAETHHLVGKGGAWPGPGPAPQPGSSVKVGGKLPPTPRGSGTGPPTASACHRLPPWR